MKALAIVAGCALAALGVAWALDPHPFVHALGIDSQQGYPYAFFSGSASFFLQLAGMGAIISGLWHRFNCHQAGCWRIGRHHVAGTPWCNRHHGDARPDESAADKLDLVIMLLEDIRTQGGPRRPGSGLL